MFSCEFCEISKNTFSTEHLKETASVINFIYIENVVSFIHCFIVTAENLIWPLFFFIFCSWWPAE